MTFDDITEDGRLWAVRYEGEGIGKNGKSPFVPFKREYY